MRRIELGAALFGAVGLLWLRQIRFEQRTLQQVRREGKELLSEVSQALDEGALVWKCWGEEFQRATIRAIGGKANY